MSIRLMILGGLISVKATATGVIGGGTTGTPAKTLEIINQELAAEIDVTEAVFQQVVKDSVAGKLVTVDGALHVADVVDLKNKQVFIRPLKAAPGKLKILVLKQEELEIPATTTP